MFPLPVPAENPSGPPSCAARLYRIICEAGITTENGPQSGAGELVTYRQSAVIEVTERLLVEGSSRLRTSEGWIREHDLSGKSLVSMMSFDVLSLEGFYAWRSTNLGSVARLAGFTSGTSSRYNETALRAIDMCTVVAWTGEGPDDTGFTALVPAFLRGDPSRRAIAFKKSCDVEDFQASWRQHVEEFADRIVVVGIELDSDLTHSRKGFEVEKMISLPEWAQDAYWLGRAAMIATGSKVVAALGGGGLLGLEAEESIEDGVEWNIYAVSRGRKEVFPSLMDWAAQSSCPGVRFDYWKDPSYAEAFAGKPPDATPMPVLTLGGFQEWWRTCSGNVAHLAGFEGGMSDCYHESVLEQLRPCSFVAWCGEAPRSNGFTSLIPEFLRGGSERKALAFVRSDAVEAFRGEWQSQAAKFRDRIVIVDVDSEFGLNRYNLRDDLVLVKEQLTHLQQRFVLARIAMRASQSKHVIALGGSDALRFVAESSFRDGVHWTVYALSRGRKEESPTLMDWIADTPSPSSTLIYWKDPLYAHAFARSPPPIAPMQVLDFEGFEAWRSSTPGDDVVHLTGFRCGMSDCCNDAALARMSSFSMVAWAGSTFAEDGFTALVPAFLRERPDRKAVVFLPGSAVAKSRGRVEDALQTSWQPHAVEFQGRVVIVCVDVEREAVKLFQGLCGNRERLDLGAELSNLKLFPMRARQAFALGRVAMRATGSKNVVALGGGGVVGQDARASAAEDVHWMVYAVSRGRKEEFPTLMDWAAGCRSPGVTSVLSMDPNYASAFSGEAPVVAPIQILDAADFADWRLANPGLICEVTGFRGGMCSCYNNMALADLHPCSVVAWDGAIPDDSSYTALVIAFLRSSPGRKAVAFKMRDQVEQFRADWRRELAEFAGRIVVVAVDLEGELGPGSGSPIRERAPSWSGQALPSLGPRILQLTGASLVVAMGGYGSLAAEAESSLARDVSWTVYALSRGQKEETPTLMDWALGNQSSRLTFIYWKDPNYADSFAGKVPEVVSCGRCAGRGRRGIFPRAGLGLISRQCAACGGLGREAPISATDVPASIHQ